MCQLFKMLDRVQDGQEKRDLCSVMMNIWEAYHLNCLVVKANLGSTIFIKQSLLMSVT